MEQRENNQPEKRAEKVVTSVARVKNKSAMRKFADVFIAEDVANVKRYILLDVIVPAVKKAISDTVDMILYPGGGGRRREGRSNASYVDYSKYARRDDDRDRDHRRSRNSYGFREVILDSRGEAEKVLRGMDDIMDMYQMVRVADMYDLAGISPDYTDHDYGWTNIQNAKIVRLSNGSYTIEMPRAIPIK